MHDPNDVEILDRQTSDHVTVAPLDVTNATSIKEFAGLVDLELGADRLHALVDNAGKGFAGPLDVDGEAAIPEDLADRELA